MLSKMFDCEGSWVKGPEIFFMKNGWFPLGGKSQAGDFFFGRLVQVSCVFGVWVRFEKLIGKYRHLRHGEKCHFMGFFGTITLI